MKDISVIIPTLNEEGHIAGLLLYLKKVLEGIDYEIIVADGSSDDETVEIAKKHKVKVIPCSLRSRAYQMNRGAEKASSSLLYFVHADTVPYESFYMEIRKAIQEGYDLGCFRFKFNSKSTILAINSFFTRFNGMMFRGGDQSLFVKKEVFIELGRYNEDFRIMEDYELIKKARGKYKFKIIPQNILVSARKYEHNSYLRVNVSNLIVFCMYALGASQEKMIKTYTFLLKHPKVESYNN